MESTPLKEKVETMSANNAYRVLKIRRRPWYAWVLWFVWGLWLLIWAEFSLGSWREMEFPAFYAGLIILTVSAALGVLCWMIGSIRFKRSQEVRRDAPSGTVDPAAVEPQENV